MTEIEQAYRITESITRTAARNFYYGIRLLPREKRAALSAVYALGGRIDDVADGELAPETKITELDAIRKSLDNIDDSSDPVLVALADAARRFPVPIAMFAELIDGARMEIDWTGCRDFDELIVYCRRGGRHDRKALSFHLWTRQHGDVAIRRAVGNRSAANQYSARRSRGLFEWTDLPAARRAGPIRRTPPPGRHRGTR